MNVIARIHTDFPGKFGVPRQSGLVPELKASIVFEPEYRNPDAVRGLEEFSHIWLIWQFSLVKKEGWSATVRPPRLGGNERKGVFATRSPYRPNPIGLSCVRLEGIDITEKYGPVLRVSGADMVDGTPVYDIKPYLPYVDCVSGASGGFTDITKSYSLDVIIPDEIAAKLPADKTDAVKGILAQDPRPAYQDDPRRVYGVPFAGYDIRFTVDENVLTVCDAVKQKQ